MSNQDFRLFINNITESINEDSLREKLSQFGDISSIEIKQRKNIIGNQTPAFAYITVNTTPENIQKCFKDFSMQKFRNVFIDISIAKESFMERLKHEREKKHNDNDQKSKNGNVLNFNKCTLQGLIRNSSKSGPDDTSSVSFEIPKDYPVVKDVFQKNHVISHLNISEQKRVHSILEKKKEYHSQKLLLQNALSRIDLQPKSKVIFYENEDYKGNTNEEEKKQKDKFELFTDGVDDNETNNKWFEVKEHFEGPTGQKLLKLQSRFRNDPRFSMDVRFLESDIYNGETINENTGIQNDDEKERKVQMKILEQVLGQNLAQSSTSQRTSKTLTMSSMLRYDPDHEDHLKYEMTPVSVKYDIDKKNANSENSTKIEHNNTPQVSEEKFYKVTENLKDALFTGQQFSILGTFGDHHENKNDYNEQIVASVLKKNKNGSMITTNPFAYDSSSDSEDDVKNNHSTGDIGSFKTQKVWTECFFFKNDDYRLQEGLDFVKRWDVNDSMDFVKLRRNIREAVKVKIKNNQKKFNPFKKKLGEMKRIKIKRALKR